MYEYLRKLYFYYIYFLKNGSTCMNIKENDIFITCPIFKKEVHVC